MTFGWLCRRTVFIVHGIAVVEIILPNVSISQNNVITETRCIALDISGPKSKSDLEHGRELYAVSCAGCGSS